MSFNHSYQPNYFSTIDIAASEERVLCKIEQDIPKLGFLDSSSDADDLKAGSKLELPLWIVKGMVATRNAAPIKCELSKIYKQNWRDILKADSSCVVLSKWNQYYYEFGLQIVQLPNMEKQLVIESLLQTFKCRYRLIMDHALNPMTDCMIPSQLPALERELFKNGTKYYKELINWIEKGSKKMETANVITNINLKKRKRMEMELD